jgi:hypothetical protein
MKSTCCSRTAPKASDRRASLDGATREWRLLGFDARRYPRDLATIVRFDRALAELGPQHSSPEPMPLAFFEHTLRKHGASHGINAHDLNA